MSVQYTNVLQLVYAYRPTLQHRGTIDAIFWGKTNGRSKKFEEGGGGVEIDYQYTIKGKY